MLALKQILRTDVEIRTTTRTLTLIVIFVKIVVWEAWPYYGRVAHPKMVPGEKKREQGHTCRNTSRICQERYVAQ